ncbi:hypothetical protein pb186bvf_011538 [Paramecium bursaria]
MEQLPIQIQINLFTYLPLKEIYLSIGLVNRNFNKIIKHHYLLNKLIETYFLGNKGDLRNARIVQLPFWGHRIQGFCPNPKLWVNNLASKSKTKRVEIQNCQFIQLTLSEHEVEFRKKFKQLISYHKDIDPQCNQKDLQIICTHLADFIFYMCQSDQRTKLKDLISYFFNMFKANIRLTQSNGATLKSDFQGIIKYLKLRIHRDSSQTPTYIMISESETVRSCEYPIIRQGQNYETYKAPGPLINIRLQDKSLFQFKFKQNELRIVSTLYIHILGTQNCGNNHGSAFSYVRFYGYLL